ncbi:hypothetical protein IU474_27500 [Nocardia otitidiscaviarum]|nr:hypothetical protein [Nocardia otitidiscaviarum]
MMNALSRPCGARIYAGDTPWPLFEHLRGSVCHGTNVLAVVMDSLRCPADELRDGHGCGRGEQDVEAVFELLGAVVGGQLYLGDAIEHGGLVRGMPVDRHRIAAQRFSRAAHGQLLDALLVDDLQRCREHGGTGEGVLRVRDRLPLGPVRSPFIRLPRAPEC